MFVNIRDNICLQIEYSNIFIIRLIDKISETRWVLNDSD